jgi:hypothetical protein
MMRNEKCFGKTTVRRPKTIRAAALALTVLAVLSSPRATHAQGQNVELIGQIGGACYAVYVQGNYAYIGEGPSLLILDITDPFSPSPLGRVCFTEMVEKVFVQGNRAYVATGKTGLQIVDVSNTQSPVLLGSYDTPGYARSVYVVGNLAYVADRESGLQIIDVSNPWLPTYRGSWDTPGYGLSVEDVCVSGSYAYAANSHPPAGLRILDVHNPSSPTLVGSFLTWTAQRIAVSAGMAYLGGERGYPPNFFAIDISVPSSPTLRGTISCETVRGLFVSGGLAYIGEPPNTFWSRLSILDVSDPQNIHGIGGCWITGYAGDVLVNGGVAYLAADHGGVLAVDVSEPSKPTVRGVHDTIGSATHVFCSAGRAYIADNVQYDVGGFEIADVTNPRQPKLLGWIKKGSSEWGIKDVFVQGNTAYVIEKGYFSEGYRFSVVDVEIPSSPTVRGYYDTPGNRVFVSNQLAYITQGENGLLILDVARPTAPTLIGSYNTPGNAQGICVSGALAFVADGSSLQIIDVSDPTSPTFHSSCSLPIATSVDVTGNMAYVAAGNNDSSFGGLYIVDVSNPSSPQLVGQYWANLKAWDVYVSSGLAYVACSPGLKIIDVSNPSSPQLRGSFDTPRDATGVFVSGDLAYVSAGSSGLRILRYTGAPTGTGGVEGYLHDERTKLQIRSGVRVSLLGGSGQVTYSSSDGRGHFAMSGLLPGGYTAFFCHADYQRLAVPFTVTAGTTTSLGTIFLDPYEDAPSKVILLVRGAGKDWDWDRGLLFPEDDYNGATFLPKDDLWYRGDLCYWRWYRKWFRELRDYEVWDANENRTKDNLVISGEQGYDWNAHSLRRYIEEKSRDFESRTGRAPRLNIVAHSFGGLITRNLLSYDLQVPVDNVVMLGTPNEGSVLADKALTGKWWEKVVGYLFAEKGIVLEECSQDHVQKRFNKVFSNWNSNTQLYLMAGDGGNGVNVLLIPTWNILKEGRNVKNDGMVTVESAHGGGLDRFVREKAISGCDHGNIKANRAVFDWVRNIVDGSWRPFSTNGGAGSWSPHRSVQVLPLMATRPLKQYQHVWGGTSTTLQNKTRVFAVPVDGASQLDVFGSTGPTSVPMTLRDPADRLIDAVVAASDPNTTFTLFQNPNTSESTMLYSIQSPPPGLWKIEFHGVNVPPEGTIVSAQVFVLSDLRLVPRGDQFATQGSTATIACAVLDGSTSVTTASINATVRAPDGTTTTLDLLDDGAHGDGAAGDAVFANGFTSTTLPGHYYVTFEAQGTDPNGYAFRRIAGSEFQVAPQTGRIEGHFTEHVWDTNGNGLYDHLTVDLWVTYDTTGTYILSGGLFDTSRTEITRASTTISDAYIGTARATLDFYGSDVFLHGVDGPYTVRDICLWEDNDTLLRIEAFSGSHVTGAYLYTEFDPPPRPRSASVRPWSLYR